MEGNWFPAVDSRETTMCEARSVSMAYFLFRSFVQCTLPSILGTRQRRGSAYRRLSLVPRPGTYYHAPSRPRQRCRNRRAYESMLRVWREERPVRESSWSGGRETLREVAESSAPGC